MAFAVRHPMGQHEEWVILAEEAAQEKDPQKLMQTIKALTEALDAKASHTDVHRSTTQGAA
jgi:hypothetical protein